MKEITVLSLFDGISCGQVALNNIKNIKIKKYYASEIEASAIQITQHNHSKTIQLGDITKIDKELLDSLGDIDLILGGFPCQDLSSAGKRKGLEGERSGLFFYFHDILTYLKEKNPSIKFLLENVKGMSKEDKKIIDDYMKVKGFMVDSAVFSSQRRKRWYWTNIKQSECPQPTDLVLKDALIKQDKNKEYRIPEFYYNTYKLLNEGEYWKHLPSNNEEKIKIENSRKKHKNPGGQTGFWKIYDKNQKSPTLTASGLKQKMTRFVLIDNEGIYRYPTPEECEKLQGLPVNYTSMISDNARYKAIGNGWNVPTIEFLLKNI